MGVICQTVRQLLSDGNWHTFGEIYQAVSGFYAPLVAIHRYEHNTRAANRERHMRRPLEQQIMLGKIIAVRVMLSQLQRRSNLECEGRRHESRFRMPLPSPAATESPPVC